MKKTILISTIATLLATPAFAIELDPLSAKDRHAQAYDYRENQADMNYRKSPALHPTNGDESAVPNYQGQFHKSLPHSNNGMVNPSAYKSLLGAIKAGTFQAFEQVPAGGPVKLANPLAAQVYDLEGRDSHDYGIKLPPKLGSAEAGAEMVEVYAQALLRDLPFSDYVGDPDITAVAYELAGLTDFLGPKTPATLFRGVFEGDQVGPYLSQFLYKDIPAGPKVVDQKYTGYRSGQNFMTSYSEWLAIENGQNPTASVVTTPARYMIPAVI